MFVAMHPELFGQESGRQLKMVQYPPGWEVSQRSVPVGEQSVDWTQLDPMDGWHPLSAKARAPRLSKRISG
jgi:hypothetical protein